MRTIKSCRTKGRPSPAASELQSFIQRKLTIGATNDVYEKEADDMANKVMGETPETLKFTTANQLQKKESNADPGSAPSIVQDVLSSSSGKNMDEDTRSYMESRFNYDFSNVRIHDNEVAAKSADSINALAYTSGNDIVFNSEQYNPGSGPGKKLLAHELTHVVQHNGMISKQPAPARQGRRFSHQGVSVLIRTSCDAADFGLDTVEAAFKEALDKIFDDDCIEITRRRAIQSNLRKHGYDVRCRAAAQIDGACAESTGFNIPANIMTLGDIAFTDADCGQLASTILHEIIHVTRGRFGEDVSESCEASCFGEDGDPDLCRNIDVFGRRP
ncbi:MAG TPA: DUF4157 domain-containing protein [Chitinophagaceae bacterium]|jgi:hypothetical protein|nr:DUF4157 domain-containing protein [Chitinophagaceae bacterium]